MALKFRTREARDAYLKSQQQLPATQHGERIAQAIEQLPAERCIWALQGNRHACACHLCASFRLRSAAARIARETS